MLLLGATVQVGMPLLMATVQFTIPMELVGLREKNSVKSSLVSL